MSDMCGIDMDGFEGSWYTHPVLRDTLIATALAVLTFVLAHNTELPDWSEKVLFGIAIFIGGRNWAWEALEKAFMHRTIGIGFLMLGATVGSIALGLWEEAATLVVLYGAAEGLEGYTFSKTRASIRKLLELAPKEARVLRDGQEAVIPVASLQVGERFIVYPGESLPTDGIILKGQSSLNESPVTGESVPVEKKEGMKVFAGTINENGSLTVEATAEAANNTLSKMVHMVEEAREQKGKAQLFIDAFGEKYTPCVLIVAILFLLIPLFGGSFPFWANKAVILLVAAAPCALIMSTPVAIATGIGTAGKNGILIKGGMYLENLGKVKVVTLDKTGTLTQGKPSVTDLLAINDSDGKFLQIAYSLEKNSLHPLASAINRKMAEMAVSPLPVSDFRSLTGAGVQGNIAGTTYYLGKPKFFEEMGLATGSGVQRLEQEGKTVVLLGTKTSLIGLIAIQDQVRQESRQAIQALRQMGITTVMLTGDNGRAANAIAQHLGINDVRSELKPEDKITAVEALQKQYGPLAMVGDGINDAPALARADVGVAMGTAGTDAAIEAADTALMGDDLNKFIYALHLGRKARVISQQNIIFSLLLLAVMIPSALLGWISITGAVFGHEAGEILAVLNGLRMAQRLTVG